MEEISPEELFKQIRASHRMVVAYYKRLFPILNEVASELDMNFYQWESVDFKQPAQKSMDIVGGKRWEWDLVPALNASYFYCNVDMREKGANTQEKEDWLLEFRVLTDTGVLGDDDELGKRNEKENQDPLELTLDIDEAKSVLEVYLFAPSKEGSLNWYDEVWGNSDYPAISLKAEHVDNKDKDNGIYANAFRLDLAELVNKNIVGVLVEKVKKYRDVLLEGIPNDETIQAMEDARANRNLEEVTIDQLKQGMS